MTQTSDKPFKIYTASAGSGKTFTIVKEYLTLCLGDNADAFREILAVTFTNKAANEMKAKILRFLLGIADNSSENDIQLMKKHIMEKTRADENVIVERSKALYTKIIHNYSDMAVTTIDKFVQQLSRSFARELNLPSQYSVILDNDDLIDEIIRLLSDEIGNNKFITKMLSNYVEYNLTEETSWNVKTSIGDFIKKLLREDAYKKGEKKEIIEIDEAKFDEIRKYLGNEIKTCDKAIDKLINDIADKEIEFGIDVSDYSYKEKGLPTVVRSMKSRKNCIASNRSREMIYGNVKWKSKTCHVDNDDILECYRNALENYPKLISKFFILSVIEKDMYLYVLRNHIFELINEFIEDSSQVHISEFNKRISDVLGDCSVPFIYERIGERYKHYFIDEFQDTSVLQWQNFLPLVDNSLSQGNMNMIVGDAKQSIYRFRGGEVEQIINLPKIYNSVDNEFTASCQRNLSASAEKKSLGTNFRSCKNIIKFNNTFFRFAQRYLEDGDDALHLSRVFDDTEQIYNSKDGGLVSLEVFSDALDTQTYHGKVLESMLGKIIELHSKGIEYKDITIQVRSNKEGTEIANYLVGNGIDVISADSIQLQSSDKVQLIVNTLQYLVNDGNPVTLKTVSYFYEKTHQGKSLALHRDNSIVRFDETFKNALQSIHNQAYSLYDLCVQLCRFYDFNILEDVFVQYFMNMLYEWQSAHSAGIDAFVEYWEKKKNLLSVQITGELNCVNIMTIHKSKGLEFRVVMYPFAETKLDTSAGFTQKEIWIQCSENEVTKDIPYLDAFLLPVCKEKLKDSDFEYILRREEQKTRLDNLNTMYVSMTRAKEMLFVYTNAKCSQTSYNIFNDFLNENADYNYIQHLRNENDDVRFDDYFLERKDITKEEKENSNVFTFGITKDNYGKSNVESKEDVDILELNENSKTPRALQWFEKLSVEPDPTMVWASKETFMPDEWGSLVHEIFSKIKTKTDIDRVLRQYVNDGSIDEKQAESLRQKFNKVVEIECLKPAYSDNAVIMNEMDIHTSFGHVMRPDRYAITGNGTILIDYKTGKHNEKYHQQLQDYMVALREMNGNQDIKAYLVYLGDEIEVEEVGLDRLF
ncbi:MAG: UvrD-helicase domain-containing protein [Bacteroidales bacterium]|nr:UvrD-helicase domain-containing protein [Bacteroidales bacterium]